MMTSVCSPEEIAYRRKIARRHTVLFAGWMILSAAAAIVICAFTRTGNSREMTALLLSVLVFAGWVAIAWWVFAVSPALSRLRHLEGLSGQPLKTHEGTFSVSPASFRIPRSVRVCPATLKIADETLRLNLDVCRVAQAPPDGSLVRVQTARRFITAIEPLSPPPQSMPPHRRRVRPGPLKHLLSLVPWMIMWALCAVIFGGFLMNRITDAPAREKLVIYVDGDIQDAAALAESLERQLNGDPRMVKVHPFSYALFGSEAIRSADLYLLPASHLGEYAEWFAPLPKPWCASPNVLEVDGTALGIPLPEISESSLLFGHLNPSAEGWVLCFGQKSLHLSALPGAQDNRAADAVRLILSSEE